jgi:hypothetical protein
MVRYLPQYESATTAPASGMRKHVACQVETLLAAATLLWPRTPVRYVTRLFEMPLDARQ